MIYIKYPVFGGSCFHQTLLLNRFKRTILRTSRLGGSPPGFPPFLGSASLLALTPVFVLFLALAQPVLAQVLALVLSLA